MTRSQPAWCWLAALVGACWALAPAAGAAVSDQPLNITGTWQSVYHCKVGWCAGQDFPATSQFVQAPGSSVVTGAGGGSGTISGRTLTFHGTDGEYSFSEVLTFSADGNSWTGTLSDSHGTSGTESGTRVAASGPTTTAPTTTAPTPTTTPTTTPATPAPYPAIVNGSFAAGATGFTSTYTQSASLGSPGTFAVQTNPRTLNPAWPSLADHTGGGGSMLIVNGATTPGQVVWSETVTVQPNTAYDLSLWVASLYPGPPVLAFSVNDSALGTRPGPTKVGSWSNVSLRWSSGSATTAKLSIVDQNVQFGGNDFAIDDITFGAAGSGSGARHNPHLSTLTSSIASPSDAFSSTRASIENAAIAAGLILFITFPSQLFNHTFEENYADIREWWVRRLGPLARRRKRQGEAEKLRAARTTLAAAVVIAVGGILGGLLDPHFGWNGSSAVTYASVLISSVFGLSLSTFVGYEYRKRRGKETAFHLQAIPAGLLIAGVCVLTSRLTGFQPGYLYGLIAGAAFGGAALAKNEQGHTTTLSVLATIAVSLLAWGIRVPLNHLATHPHEAWPVVLGDDFVGALFTGGIVGSTIGLFPLRFLPGGTIAAWHRGAWAATFGFVVFLFLEAILNPGKGGHAGGASLTTGVLLFVVFGGGSVVFYRHFAQKTKRAAAEATTAGDTAEGRPSSSEPVPPEAVPPETTPPETAEPAEPEPPEPT